MTLYEINQAMEALIDSETGELLDYEAFSSLALDRVEKIENTALWVKNLEAEAAAIKAEEKALADRRRPLENRAEGLRKYLAELLGGEKYTFPRVALSWRKSRAIEVEDETAAIDALERGGYTGCLTYSPPKINRRALTTLIEDGVSIPGTELVERQNLQIR